MNKKSSTLSTEKKDKYLDKLLIFMKNDIEQLGIANYSRVRFNFKKPDSNPAGEDRIEFLSKNRIKNNEFDLVLNYAITHKFIKPICMNNPFDLMIITDDGMDRAMSTERAMYKPAVGDNAPSIHIGSINGDNVQVGNNNTQSIYNTFNYLIDKIQKSNATAEEKKTALTKIKECLNNPIVSGITSGCTVEIIKSLTGMGI